MSSQALLEGELERYGQACDVSAGASLKALVAGCVGSLDFL